MALAYLLMHKGQVEKAVAELDALLDIYPDYLAARYARENLRRRLDDRNGAKADGTQFVNDPRVYEFLVDVPIALRVFQRLASDLLREQKFSEALSVARRAVTFAERLGEDRGECHYSLARCLARAAASQPALFSESWRELQAVALAPECRTLRKRFETDRAFSGARRLLREAFPPWVSVEPRQVDR
jgi:tetratricopeptide (TPR) repeat protein